MIIIMKLLVCCLFGEDKANRGSSKSRRRLLIGEKRNFSKTNFKNQKSFSIKYTEQTV